MTIPAAAALTARKVAPHETAAVARTLAAAFLDDPVTEFFLPDPATRAAKLYRGVRSIWLDGIGLRHDETYTVDGVAGAAVWIPPGKAHAGAVEQVSLLWRQLRVSARDIVRGVRGTAVMDAAHPIRPHWFLPWIGTRPERQGEGVGSALISVMTDRCDATRTPAYLQATSARSVSLYERHGFRLTGEIRFPLDGPVIYGMWRDPA
jgi:GNAT superfamily N-acetyltransferase